MIDTHIIDDSFTATLGLDHPKIGADYYFLSGITQKQPLTLLLQEIKDLSIRPIRTIYNF